MFTEICLAILTAALVALVFVIWRLFSQAQKSIHLLQTDIHRLLNTMNDFVRDDLHAVSKETRQVIRNLNDLSADINNKSHSLNFLFKPLSFLSSKLGGDLTSEESPSNCETIPQALKWIASSALLFKTIKEFIKR